MSKINYENKEAWQDDATIPDKNKVTAENMNEIKRVVNENDNKFNNYYPSNDIDIKLNAQKNMINNLEEKHNNDISAINNNISNIETEQTTQNKNIKTNTDKNTAQDIEIEKLKSNLINLSAEGEEIQVNDSSDLEAKIEIYGNTKQATTKGNQLFACNGDSKSVNGVTMTNDNGLFTITGKATKTLSIELTLFDSFQKANLEGGQEYTQQVFDISGKRNFNIITAIQKVSGEVLYNYFISSPEFPTITKNIEANSIGYTNTAYIAEGQEVNCSFKVMLTKGKEKAIWEEYTGGQPSPNPDYPQEVESVKAYNLFDKSNVNLRQEISGSNGTTIPSASFFVSDYIKVKPNTSYKVTKTYNIDGIIGTSFCLYDINKKFIQTIATGNQSTNDKIIEVPNNNKIAFMRFNGDMSILDVIQIVEGTKQKPYQKYGKIEVKQTGKNLFDKNKAVRSAINETGNLYDAGSLYYTTDYIKIDPNKFYSKNDTGSPRVKLFDKNKKVISTTSYNDIPNFNYSGSYKSPFSNAQYIRYTYNINSATSDQVVFEEGKVLEPYEPYKETIYPIKLGNIELNELGDSEDYFHRINGKWHLHKEIEKYVFTGNEDWSLLWEETENTLAFYYNTGISNDEKNRSCICNSFKSYAKIGTPINQNNEFIMQGNRYFAIRINKNRLSTLDVLGFKEFLKNKKVQGNPVIVWYELETPEEIEILDPTLIEQLNALENAKLFKSTTRLTNNSIAIMKLDYIADTKAYIDNKLSQIAIANEKPKAQIMQSTPQTIPEIL